MNLIIAITECVYNNIISLALPVSNKLIMTLYFNSIVNNACMVHQFDL